MTLQPSPLGAMPTGLPEPPVGRRPERMPDRSPLPASSRPDDGSTAFTRTRRRDGAASGTSTYSTVLQRVKADGLLGRTTVYRALRRESEPVAGRRRKTSG